MHFCKPALNVTIWTAGLPQLLLSTYLIFQNVSGWFIQLKDVTTITLRFFRRALIVAFSCGQEVFFTVGNQSTRDNVRIQDNHCRTT